MLISTIFCMTCFMNIFFPINKKYRCCHFLKSSCNFLLFWIIFSGGLSSYANKNHILLSMALFMNIFFPISKRFRCLDCHFLISSCIFFLDFSQFFSYVILVLELPVYPNRLLSKQFCLQPFFHRDSVSLLFA